MQINADEIALSKTPVIKDEYITAEFLTGKNNSQQNGNSNWTPKNEQPSKIEIQRPSQPSRQEINPPKQERTNMSLPAPRQESRTPMVQPRNEPKQFRQEAPAPQKNNTAPSQPSRPNNSGDQRSGGGRRK